MEPEANACDARLVDDRVHAARRVEILAYQDYASWAWNVLPVFALIELTAVTLLAVNLFVTFIRPSVVVTTPLTMTTE